MHQNSKDLLDKTAFPYRDVIIAPALMDFYKACHHMLYKEGVTEVCTNFTARSGSHSNIEGGTTYMWAGAQSFINAILVIEWSKFFAAPVEQAVADYKRVNEHGIGVECDTSHLEALHALGYLPLEIRALPEGSEVPYGVPAMTVRSTHSEFFWLPNAIETIQSDQIWPMQTSLTTATEYMRNIRKFGAIDGTPEFLFPFLGHDFSMRGMMGGKLDSGATLSGSGHNLAGFAGSDTLPVAFQLERDYGASLDPATPCSTIASVYATEHSVQCSFNNDDERYFRNAIAKVPDDCILSLVSDGYDFWKLVTEVLPKLHDVIMNREGGKLVIRPDSGDPVDVLCGLHYYDFTKEKGISEGYIKYISENPDRAMELKFWEADIVKVNGKFFRTIKGDYIRRDKYPCLDTGYTFKVESYEEVPEHQVKGLIEVLWDQFGGTEEGGYKFLDSHIGAIYGDSITLERQVDIYERLHAKGFAIGNVVLGIGSYSYQYVTRDTHGSAIKATHIIIDGVHTPISKEVKGCEFKKSAKGYLFVRVNAGEYELVDNVSRDQFVSEGNCLEPIWVDGEWEKITTLDEVRSNVAKAIG